MQKTDITNPSERKKLIGAIVLGALAIILLWWTFFGFGSSGNSNTRATQKATPTPVRSPTPRQPTTNGNVEQTADMLSQLVPISGEHLQPAVPDARRNIFVYYEKPIPPPPTPPPPTPPPPPPVLLAGVSPSMVYARTGEFALEVTGDKFTPQLRVVIDGVEMQTRYRGPQQLSATVPASIIATAGTRQIVLRSPDGSLFSNATTLNVTAPPTPNFSYVGIIGTPRYVDTAIMQDKNNREIVNVQRGDLLGGRFRVTSISEKEVVVTDPSLKINHKIAFTSQPDRGGGPVSRPTPRADDDDEP